MRFRPKLKRSPSGIWWNSQFSNRPRYFSTRVQRILAFRVNNFSTLFVKLERWPTRNFWNMEINIGWLPHSLHLHLVASYEYWQGMRWNSIHTKVDLIRHLHSLAVMWYSLAAKGTEVAIIPNRSITREMTQNLRNPEASMEDEIVYADYVSTFA